MLSQIGCPFSVGWATVYPHKTINLLHSLHRFIQMTKVAFLLTALIAAGSLSLKAEDIATKYDENPMPVRTVAPKAPSGESGLVAVVCVIDESGNVIETTVKKSTNASLDQAAIAALQGWSFKPAKIAGKAVRSKVTVPVRFEDRA